MTFLKEISALFSNINEQLIQFLFPKSDFWVSAVTTMADSDGEYMDDLSDDDIGAPATVNAGHGTRSTGAAAAATGAAGPTSKAKATNGGGNRRRAAWEDIQRSWDTVVEGADGSINSTVEGLREANKRKR